MIVRDTGKSRRVALVLGAVLLALQLGVAPNIGILGGRANLALVFVGCTCLGGDVRSAPALGFCAGLLYDLAGTGPIGLMALLLTLLGWFLAASDRPGPADDLGGAMALFVPAAVLVGVVYAVVLLALGVSSSPVDALLLRALPGAALDCACFALAGMALARAGAGSGGGLSLSGGRGPAHGRGGRDGRYTMRRGL